MSWNWIKTILYEHAHALSGFGHNLSPQLTLFFLVLISLLQTVLAYKANVLAVDALPDEVANHQTRRKHRRFFLSICIALFIVTICIVLLTDRANKIAAAGAEAREENRQKSEADAEARDKNLQNSVNALMDSAKTVQTFFFQFRDSPNFKNLSRSEKGRFDLAASATKNAITVGSLISSSKPKPSMDLVPKLATPDDNKSVTTTLTPQASRPSPEVPLANEKVSAPKPIQTMHVPDSNQLATQVKIEHPGVSIAVPVFEREHWHPIDLTSVPNGVAALDDGGQIWISTKKNESTSFEVLAKTGLNGRSGYLAATNKFIFVLTDSKNGCTVSRFLLSGGLAGSMNIAAKQKLYEAHRCGGISAIGDAIYVLISREKRVAYWSHWNTEEETAFSQKTDDKNTAMIFEPHTNKLLVVDGENIYSHTLDGTAGPEAWSIEIGRIKGSSGNSIAANEQAVYVAAGKKVKILTQSTGQTTDLELPRAQKNLGGVTGLSLDGSNSVWIADGNGWIMGPMRTK